MLVNSLTCLLIGFQNNHTSETVFVCVCVCVCVSVWWMETHKVVLFVRARLKVEVVVAHGFVFVGRRTKEEQMTRPKWKVPHCALLMEDSLSLLSLPLSLSLSLSLSSPLSRSLTHSLSPLLSLPLSRPPPFLLSLSLSLTLYTVLPNQINSNEDVLKQSNSKPKHKQLQQEPQTQLKNEMKQAHATL